jgi:predicted nucleic-acid-binding Zn-ribbon protein
MATAKCPKCESTSFELKENSVQGSNFRLNFVQCTHCGCVVGVQEYFNIGALIKKFAKKLNINLD